jgi:hypothetical protein
MSRSRSVEKEPALIAPETLVFVMLGAFMMACGGFRIAYEHAQPDPSRWAYYLYSAMMIFGLVFIGIGLSIGRMALRTRAEVREETGRDPLPPTERRS